MLMIENIPSIIVLPIAFAFPVLIIIISFRLNFILHASIFLIVFLLGSVFAGASGLLSIYRHVSNILELGKMLGLLSLLYQSQTITRSLLSTVSSAIFIVKFLTAVTASKETVNNAGIGFFILMLVTKFCCATIIPNNEMLCELLEILESCLDLVCLLSSGLFHLLVPRSDSVHPVTESSQTAHSPPLHLPKFYLMATTRVFLLVSLTSQYRHSYEDPALVLYQDLFAVLHGLITPLLLFLTIPGLREQMVKIPHCSRAGSDQVEELELETLSHRPESAPTRPSSAVIPTRPELPGQASDSTTRVPYKSNIRSPHLTNSRPPDITSPFQEAPVCPGGRGLGSQEAEAEEGPGEGRGASGQGDAQHGRGEGDSSGGE